MKATLCHNNIRIHKKENIVLVRTTSADLKKKKFKSNGQNAVSVSVKSCSFSNGLKSGEIMLPVHELEINS